MDEKREVKTNSGFKNYADDPILAKFAYEFVMDLHRSLKKKRKNFELMWEECQDAYRCIEKKTYFQGTLPYCASDLRDAVLQIVPKLAKAVWYQDIPFELVPVGEQGDDEDLSEVNQQVLSWDFKNLRIYLKYVDAMIQKGVYGTTVVKTPPHFEFITKNLREWSEMKYGGQKSLPGRKEMSWKQDKDRMFMGTDFVVTDLLDFWIDPTVTQKGIKDLVQYSDCIESIVVKQTALKLGKEKGYYTNIAKIEDYYVGRKSSKGEDTSAKQQIRKAGHINTTDEENAGMAFRDRGNKNYEVKECYADFDLGRGVEPCLIVIGADKECIRLQPWEADKPFLSSRWYGNGYNKEFYGTGIVETNLSNHYERNATRKQVLTARTMGLNMEMFSDQSGFPNKPDRLRTAPNKIHFVKNINGIKPFEKPIGQILNSAIAHETNLKSETQLSTGNTPYIQGAGTQQINDTAAGISMLTQAGNDKFSLPLQLDETGLLEPFVKRCLLNNVEYRKESFVIRLTDKKPIKVYPEDLSPNFDVYCKGSSELQNKQIRQAGLLKAWEISLGAAQIETALYGQPLTKFYELKQEIFANLGISQPENLLIDPKDLQQTQPPLLTPEVEWILLKRMATGAAQVMPILIQPGEDYRDHYEKHKAITASEEFAYLPDPIKYIWTIHINSYDPVLKVLESKKREVTKDKEIEMQEVAVNV